MSQFETKCPHCSASLTVQDDWIGMDVECPECKKEFTVQKDPAAPNPAITVPTESVQSDNSGAFIFICPPPTEKKCPYCGKPIKKQAKICKYCKKEIPSSTNSIICNLIQKSKVILSSLQNTRDISSRLLLKKSIFIISCIFFLAACIIFGFAVFSSHPHFSPRSESGETGERASTSSYGSISVGESSYATYRNAKIIANNTNDMLKLSCSFQNSLSDYYEADQRRKMLFNTSYGLLAMAIFLLLVSHFIDQILVDKKLIMAAQKDDNA